MKRVHNCWSGQGHLLSKHNKGWARNPIRRRNDTLCVDCLNILMCKDLLSNNNNSNDNATGVDASVLILQYCRPCN